MPDPPPDVPIDDAYVRDAAQPDAEARVRARLPAVLKRIAGKNKLVGLAKETYQYATDPAVPTRYKVLGLATLLYLINPMDAIPDVIPVAGYIDDAAALTAFVVAVRKIVGIVRDAAKDVVTHAAEQAETTLVNRGFAQLGLTLWTGTLAASIGLVYTGARAAVTGDASGTFLDPFAIACLATAAIGVAASADFARRVWQARAQLPSATRDRLTHAVVSQVTGRRLAVLALPIVTLTLILIVRLVFRFT